MRRATRSVQTETKMKRRVEVSRSGSFEVFGYRQTNTNEEVFGWF